MIILNLQKHISYWNNRLCTYITNLSEFDFYQCNITEDMRLVTCPRTTNNMEMKRSKELVQQNYEIIIVSYLQML